MKTILIPVDFTATSENAVNYAAEWSKRYNYERIILLKSFYDSVFEGVALSEGYGNVNQDVINNERRAVSEQLHNWCRNLAAKLPQVKVLTAMSEMPLLRAIMEAVRSEHPELIVLGSDNYRYSSDSFVAGNVISIAKTSPVRVLIIPANYTYQPVGKALVPCDFNMLPLLDKVNLLRKNPYWHDIHLHVLHVDAKGKFIDPDDIFREREKSLQEYLKNFQYTIHYRSEPTVISGIKNFLTGQEVQLIIALPGRHSFLYNLTHGSISEAIYRNARQPVLILK